MTEVYEWNCAQNEKQTGGFVAHNMALLLEAWIAFFSSSTPLPNTVPTAEIFLAIGIKNWCDGCYVQYVFYGAISVDLTGLELGSKIFLQSLVMISAPKTPTLMLW